MPEKSEHETVDWVGHADRLIDTAISVIGNKLMGVNTPTGAGVTVSPTSVAVYGSQSIMLYFLIGMAIVGAVIVLKK